MKAFPNSEAVERRDEYITTIDGIDLYWNPDYKAVVAVWGDTCFAESLSTPGEPDFCDKVPPNHPARDFAKTYLNMIS